jgi:uncharacterized radical SAM superfamily protein
MKRISIFLLITLGTLKAFGQPDPFKVTFTKMYLGDYDPVAHAALRITPAPIDFVDVDFDGQNITMIYTKNHNSDTLVLILTLLDTQPGDDFVEYKYSDDDGYILFLRYARYNIPGIIELSLFHPNMKKFFYIKKKRAHE